MEAVVPLHLVAEICATPEAIRANIAETLGKSYTRFNEYIESRSGVVSVCGFGPSLARTYKQLEGDVVACNGAHDWLIERGVIPTFGMFYDADPIIADFITPHPEVTYLIASRCHPKVFEKVRGYKVVVWHVEGDKCLHDMLAERRCDEPMVRGGSGAVVRSIVLMHAIGYREIHIHGGDSSYEGEFTHVKKSLVEEKFLEVCTKTPEGEIARRFKTTPQLALQVEDWKMLAPPMSQHLETRFVVHGDGLLPHIARAMGYEVRDSNSLEVVNELACV